MKRLIKMLIFALAAFLIWNLAGKTDNGQELRLGETTAETDIPQEKEVQETALETEAESTSAEAAISYYVYSIISPSEQKLYREIYETISTVSYEAEISATNTDAIRSVLEYVLADHPEIFYIDGYDCITYTSCEGRTKLVFRPVYTLKKEEILERQIRMELITEQILAGMPQGTDDYPKIKYLYEYLIKNTEYKTDAPENQSLVSALIYGESVCQGYAKAFQFLCRKAEIQAVQISGTADGSGHAWTLVKSNGEWYHVDPTWGDAVYRMTDPDAEQQMQELPQISYDYLLIPTDELLRTHTINSSFLIPICDSTRDNYYVREGLLLDEYNEEKIAELFRNAVNKGQDTLTFKCRDTAVYSECCKELIGNRKVFAYLKNTKTLTYIESYDQMTLTFRLTD